MGRILCYGILYADFDTDKVDLYIESAEGSLKLVKDTWIIEDLATKILSAKEVKALADIKQGFEEATAWGCDFSYDYIKINADYRS